jgi:hypothetical protein
MRHAALFILLIAFSAVAAEPAGDPRPQKQDEIQAAIERGNTLRTQEEIVPAALQSCSIIMKRNGVRCGHVYMSILGARNEGGGTYRFTLQMKAAVVRGDKAVVVQNDGTFLLGSDLSLINGEMNQRSEWQERGAGGGPLGQQVLKFSTANDTLTCEVSERSAESAEFKKTGEQKLPLKTFKPIPSEVLVALASFAVKKDALKLDDGKGVCVPTISLSETRTLAVKPAWVSFHTPADSLKSMSRTSQDEIASVVRIRYLKGGMADTGLQVTPPTAEDWAQTANYGLDLRQRVVALPLASDASVTLEAVEASKLNPKEPFDFDAIIKSFEGKAEPAPNADPKRP